MEYEAVFLLILVFLFGVLVGWILACYQQWKANVDDGLGAERRAALKAKLGNSNEWGNDHA